MLIKQNRMGYLSDRRAHLNLQISLLAEREITRMLQIANRWRSGCKCRPARLGNSPKIPPSKMWPAPWTAG